jgi:lipopolysaccharide transport system ATP-binding protein
MSDIIRVENVSKCYQLGVIGTGTLANDINRWWAKIRGKEDPTIKIDNSDTNDQKNKDHIWALKDINFKVKQGEVIGIIGKNGAGKSTLLKILSKVTAPTKGVVKIKGRVASLLEVGTGFHPELTGRENIYLNGTMLGMTKTEIKIKFDEIVGFSGVEKYIDTPVKRYSSGMYVRLAFAVAAHLEPEILIIDEVLAVGDAEFQEKCLGKMDDVSKKNGRTVLFVSHNMGAISKLCEYTVLLHNGKLIKIGKSEEIIDFYLNSLGEIQKQEYVNKNSNKEIFFSHICFFNKANQITDQFKFDESINLRINCQFNEKIKDVHIACIIKDKYGKKIFTSQYPVNNSFSGNELKLFFQIPPNFLVPGSYKLTVGIHIPKICIFDELDNILTFNILETGSDLFLYDGSDYGNVFCNCNWFIVD